jgi:hypothetical protein
MFSCTPNDTTATKALQSMGFTNIQLTGYEFTSCSKEDELNTGFTATNAQGQSVSGVVCCGWLKDCTVRF